MQKHEEGLRCGGGFLRVALCGVCRCVEDKLDPVQVEGTRASERGLKKNR